MDPITLATVTAALTMLATECAKGVASEAGKSAWTKIKSLFGWKAEPAPAQLPTDIAERLAKDDALLSQVAELLKKKSTGTASMMVGSIRAKKVVVAKKIKVGRDFKM